MLKLWFCLSLSLVFFTACGERMGLLQDQLGKTSTGVIGGQEVDADDSLTLSVVALRDKSSRDNTCTGTVLSPRLILTAAHCVEDYLNQNTELEVVLGPSSWETDQGEVFGAEKIIAHPFYFEKAQRDESEKVTQKCLKSGCSIQELAAIDQADIAIIKLAADLPSRMGPVTLNKKHSYTNGIKGLVAGFGQHSIEDSIDTGFLRFFKAPIYRRYQDIDLTRFRKLLIPSTLTTGACFGDSGGPAFVKIHGKQIQLGIGQGALQIDPTKKFACGFKSLGYTDVSAYFDWIQKTRLELEKGL